jgi:hypothetical protein
MIILNRNMLAPLYYSFDITLAYPALIALWSQTGRVIRTSHENSLAKQTLQNPMCSRRRRHAKIFFRFEQIYVATTKKQSSFAPSAV